MTELSGNVLVLGLDHHHRAITGEPELLAAAGQMECLATVRLVDDDMKDVAVGDVGEIVVSGDQVMKGYWRAEEYRGSSRRRLAAHRRPRQDG